jgi:hypothetical protein
MICIVAQVPPGPNSAPGKEKGRKGQTGQTLAEAQINGRQIRNLTRLARILHPEGRVTLEQMRGVLRYGCA